MSLRGGALAVLGSAQMKLCRARGEAAIVGGEVSTLLTVMDHVTERE